MDDEGVYHHKRLRMSPPLTPDRDEENDMDVMSAGRESKASSDASSDWGDWADRQMAHGETPGGAGVEAEGEVSAVDSSGKNEQDDQWIRKQMEQPSAVLAADNRAWDYVLQMVVDEGQGEASASEAATVASPVQEVRGAAATEFVSRWLRSNLPIALPSFNALGLVSARTHPGSGSGGRAVVDSVAAPSAVAVVSCSPEQSMHRVNLFSLTANAGSALAAALVQPGAAGLLATAAASWGDPESDAYSGGSSSIGELSGEHPHGEGGRSKRGVVVESLDSRIHMDSLVSAMGRLGLAVKYRSRCGLWRLRPGAVLLPAAESNGKSCTVAPLTPEDASFVSRCCGLQPGGALPTNKGVDGAAALVRGLIRRNPSAGIRRGNQLVAWCLSFDNGLAGALHVAPLHLLSPPPPSLGSAERGEERGGLSPQSLVLALLESLLVQPSDAELPIVSDNSSRDSLGVEGGGAPASAAQQYQPDVVGFLDWSASRTRAGLAAVVIDDKSPFVGLFEELGLLERVCDADWVRFEHVAHRTSNGGGSRAPTVVVDRDENAGGGGGGPVELPLATMVMQP